MTGIGTDSVSAGSAGSGTRGAATRTVCVLVADWPLLTALEHVDSTPEHLAVMEQHRVIAATSAACAAGVHAGMKKRSAQATCPALVLVDRARDAEYALFETVAAAVDTVAAGVESLRPGLLLMPAAGAARHAGGEEQLAEKLINAVADLTGFECSVGIADGPLAAIIAARTGRIIHPGRSGDFLAPHPITALLHAPLGDSTRFHTTDLSLTETISLLTRLGMHTLGDFAALPARAVVDRFGPAVHLLHLLAGGSEPSASAHLRPEQPILVERSLDPPVERVDQAAFAAKPMAQELQSMLRSRGAVCTRLSIIARSAEGHETARTWRHDGALSTGDVVDRVRWQCDAWIQQACRRSDICAGAIVHLQLLPEQIVPAGSHAPALWGAAGEKTARAHRALTRAQSIAGERSVLVPAPAGGRLLSDLSALMPFRTEAPSSAPGPWPGRLPAPLPTIVFPAGAQPGITLIGTGGSPVLVTARGLLSEAPSHAVMSKSLHPAIPSGAPLAVTAHSTPQLIDQAWWRGADQARRGARLQIVLEHTHAVVLLSDQGSWFVEGLYG